MFYQCYIHGLVDIFGQAVSSDNGETILSNYCPVCAKAGGSAKDNSLPRHSPELTESVAPGSGPDEFPAKRRGRRLTLFPWEHPR